MLSMGHQIGRLQNHAWHMGCESCMATLTSLAFSSICLHQVPVHLRRWTLVCSLKTFASRC